jgi:peptidoglycan hydrolase-like protein with peptidoglycan-binding domain
VVFIGQVFPIAEKAPGRQDYRADHVKRFTLVFSCPRDISGVSGFWLMEEMVPNPGQPTIGLGATGDVVRRLQRALRRTPDLGISVDGVFGPQLEAAVKSF